MTLQLSGVHHVSTISAEIGLTHGFYPRVMGLRPVIKTVNQDDVGMYHLFYGDGAGSPGSDLTVFDIPHAAPELRGNNSLTRTTFRVAGARALEYWAARLQEHGVRHHEIAERDGRAVLDFEDPVGTQLSLVDDGGSGAAFPWSASPVPAEYQSRGLGYVELTVPVLEPTDTFLTAGLGLVLDHHYTGAAGHPVHVYRIGAGGAHAEVHVAVRPATELRRARPGSGGVHHVALRIPEGQSQPEWVERLDRLGYLNSGIIDRHYFRSVYVREPNHVLFELATDGPGFAVDGPIDAERLSLPPFLEPHRNEIAERLKPLVATHA